ncbi:MAG TPA: tetratricopeptide repeat protein [Gemmatimonadales bacterium]|nr:tetratricopeptide repeat protein [Gemmatimonadales bacterium]
MMDANGRFDGNQRLAQARRRFAVGDHHGAVLLLDDLIAAGCAYADAHQLRGVALALLGQPTQALAAFDAALALNPHYVEALLHRGLVLGDLGRTEEAADDFRRAAAEETEGGDAPMPRPVRGHLAAMHVELAEAYAAAGAPDRAVEQYRGALELGPDYHDLRHRLGRALLHAGRPLEAREELEQVVEACPAMLDARAALGLARYLSGDVAGAEAVWHACRELSADDPRIDAYLAMVERVPR